MSFGKLWECMFHGSMFGMGPTAFAVWTYIIAHAKPPGTVEVNPKVVAAMIGCPAEDVEKVLQLFLQPDKQSRNQEHEGRRLLPCGPFTYQVTGWDKYQQMRNEEARREQNRQAQQRLREKRRDDDRQQPSAEGNPKSAKSAHVDGDRDKKKQRSCAPERPEGVSEGVWNDWVALRRKKRATVTVGVLRTIRAEAEKAHCSLESALATAVAQGWAGFRADWVMTRNLQKGQQRHIPNMPLGSPSCNCEKCRLFRAKREGS